MLGMRTYWDQEHAGRQLARWLRRYSMAHPVVIALGADSVLVARQVSDRLNCDLDVLVISHVVNLDDTDEVIGAVDEDGVTVIDRSRCASEGIPEESIELAVRRALTESTRRGLATRGGLQILDLQGRTVIVVDAEVETGLRMSAGILAARRRGASRVIAATPIGRRRAIENLQSVADEVLCPMVRTSGGSAMEAYQHSCSVDDSDVAAILRQAAHREVAFEVGDPHGRGWQVQGTLTVPRGARGVVVFAHGSGSSRWSPRNQEVATSLNESGFATMLFDLLTEEEGHDRRFIFDIDFLAERLIAVIDWCTRDDRLRDLSMGIFGASTGAAAALIAAARRPDLVRAVVSRGGRPDLAGDILADVDAPTLLIVGGDDEQVMALNKRSLHSMSGLTRLEVVPDATHLFEEAGALERVSRLAASWFDEFFSADERVTGSMIRYRRTS